MPLVPKDYVSVFHVALRAAEAAPSGALPARLDKVMAAVVEARHGPAWDALLGELSTDKAHGPHTVNAYALCAGRETVEIPAAFWQRGPKREWKPRNHDSLYGHGWRIEGGCTATDSDTLDMHVWFEEGWALPVIPNRDAEAFVARYATAMRGDQAASGEASEVSAWLESWAAAFVMAHGRPPLRDKEAVPEGEAKGFSARAVLRAYKVLPEDLKCGSFGLIGRSA